MGREALGGSSIAVPPSVQVKYKTHPKKKKNLTNIFNYFIFCLNI